MARVEKYSIAAAGHLIDHYERRQKFNKETGEMEYVRFGNRDIDTRWTPLNYRLWPPPYDDADVRDIFISGELLKIFENTRQDPDEGALQRFRRILRETPHAKRRDLKCICDWAISLPDEIPCDRMGEFFDMCVRYCCIQYGAENLIGAWVHVDEAHRPHLHVAFVPVVGSGSNRRICAKEVLNRKHLKSWHGGLSDRIRREMRIENPGILNGRTLAQGGNRTVRQMKASDKAYDRTKGKEVNKWRAAALSTLQEAVRHNKANLQDNILVATAQRDQAQLKEPRQATLRERLSGR